MTSLLDLTHGKRVSLADLILPAGLIIGCVVTDHNILQLTPPCEETSHLSFIFLNGAEIKRFIFIGSDDNDDIWLSDDGATYTTQEIADLPLQLASQHTPLTKENLRRFDS